MRNVRTVLITKALCQIHIQSLVITYRSSKYSSIPCFKTPIIFILSFDINFCVVKLEIYIKKFPEFLVNWRMKAARLSALRTDRLYPFYPLLLLEAQSAPRPKYGRRG